VNPPTHAAPSALSLEQLQKWEALKYGMFIHYGMSTYTGSELPDGSHPSTLYAPDKLDVDQWVSVARDAGMKYAVLTTKHVAGHCLWPTKLNDYHVGTSGNKTDVVEAFVSACEKRGVLPGFYYCSWDNHNRFGSRTYSDMTADKKPGNLHPFTTRTYQDFQTAQLEELLTGYGKIAEVWIDIPGMLPRCYREELYRNITTWQPETVVMNNNGIGDGSNYPVINNYGVPCIDMDAWPADRKTAAKEILAKRSGELHSRQMPPPVNSPDSAKSRRSAEHSSFQRFSFQHFSFTQTPLFPRNPFFPRLRSGHRLFQGPPAQSKFLAVAMFLAVAELGASR
jgi:alpha-L-fucosidase